MIHTITINTAIDKIVHIEGILTQKHNNRTKKKTLDIGGKATHVAVALQQLGHDVVATGFIGGENGRILLEMMHSYEVKTDFINQKNAETRESIVLLDESGQGSYMITEKGFEISKKSYNRLIDYINNNVKKDDFVVFAGSPPPNFPIEWYDKLLSITKQQEARLIVDVSRKYLELALKHDPYLVKPNEFEFNEIMNKDLNTVEEYAQALTEQQDKVKHWIISLGKRGSLLKISDDTVIHCIPPKIQEVNETGAGDFFVSGLVSAIDLGLDEEEMLRLASAMGASKAMQEESSAFNINDIEGLKQKCKFERIKFNVI